VLQLGHRLYGLKLPGQYMDWQNARINNHAEMIAMAGRKCILVYRVDLGWTWYCR
jgi:hypothetical protein